MPAATVFRADNTGSAALAQAATLAAEIPTRGYGQGFLEIPSGFDATTTAYFKMRPVGQDGWLDVYEADGSRAAAAGCVANRAVQIPASAMLGRGVKPIFNTACTTTAGALSIGYVLKF